MKRRKKGTDAMPTRNANLTNKLDGFIAYQVKSGRYENASEVVRDGLRILERAERQHLATIRAAMNQAKVRGIAEGLQK
jgi:antitoxin ParD1/3/4